MAGAYSAGAKEGGHAFVALNQSGGRSESAIIWFNSTVHVQQAMTKDKALLHAAVDSIPAEGGSALWDGVWAGIEELHAHGSAGSHMLILLTDGADSSSAHSLAEVIAFARNTIFRVYAIGIGRNVDSVSLRLLSDTTDGRYFAVADPGDLPSVYRTICSDFERPFGPCTLFYQSTCLGDTLRTLELSISNVCGDSASASTSFPAPGVPIIQGPRAACPNTPLQYSVTDHPGSWYRWEARGGTIIQGGSSASVLIAWPHGGEGPAGTVIVREETDYCSAVDSLHVTRLRSAFPVIDALGPTQFCQGDSVILDAGAGWDYYRWSTGWPTGDTTRRIVVKKSGSFSVGTGWYGGCGDRSLPVTVTVFPKAYTPTILRRGDTLRCGMAAVSYTWMRNGVPLSIGNAREFVLAETGTYTVTITNANGCSSTSPPFIVTTLPVERTEPMTWRSNGTPSPCAGISRCVSGMGMQVQRGSPSWIFLDEPYFQRRSISTIMEGAGSDLLLWSKARRCP
ncbi:MAG: VWA domain-containing protein [Ignavibacteria bacterium]|nr:VWA domain-containing protein [Ignavibacteria bacterium]